MDCRSTVEELISGGNLEVGYGLIDSQNFPPIMGRERKRFLQYKEIHLINNGPIDTDRAIENLKQITLRPADIFDLLTLNRTYPASPGVKKVYSLSGMSIIALGSLLAVKGKEGLQLAPILNCGEDRKNPLDTRRYIHLNDTEYYDEREKKVKKFDDWWPDYWFAAVLL